MIVIDQLQDERSAVIMPLWNDPATPPAFKAFYATERPKITAPILWRVKYPFMQSMGQCMKMENDPRFVIFLERIPPHPTDAAIVAHELTHVLLFQEGFIPPSAQQRATIHTAASGLGSMLQDPLIARRLRRYGFTDPAPALAAIDSILNRWTESSSPKDRFVFAACFVCVALEYKEISGQQLPTDRRQRLKQKFPRIYAAVRRIERAIDAAGGYETQAQHTAIYRRVIREFNLQGELLCP